MTEVRVPDIGAADIRVGTWLVDVGDEVMEGDRLVELSSPGVIFDVASPADGMITRIAVLTGSSITPGELLGQIDDFSAAGSTS
ncbi:biotin/lipoyl-containing protein [Stratiformator vulcanicus]|uniref:Dihydrolipoamide acetyltransferase n=1 Tax=Stratiformator vulcanicus TaxID=2527980 RepID=A0A517QZM1_9PLAN|nr:biotin/lipoyl-containing protein [Stratiformator vulcanicus]QDT37095.1 dihydrolipoamide acetyltransferase [Stratiformator vulcanicus]